MNRTPLTLLALCALRCSAPAPIVDAGHDAGAPDAAVTDAGPGCPVSHQRCDVHFTLPYSGEASVELRGTFWPTGWALGSPLTRDGGPWSTSISAPLHQPIQYKYVIDGGTWLTDPTNPHTITDDSHNTNSLIDTVDCAAPTCSNTFDWRDAVIYFVFVDRYFDADPSTNCHVDLVDPPGNYQGGDWKGVTSKINAGYFNELGVNALWLTVPLQNPLEAGHGTGGDTHLYSGYHGYWPVALDQSESCFGSKQDLIDLVTAAHAHHLKVLFDYAMVHVHASSTLFAQHPDWFWPNSFNGGNCICGENCDWNAQGDRCWFTDYLPHWNYTVADARNASVDAALTWVKDTGADGLRLDAIKHVDSSWLTQLRSRLTTEVLATQARDGRFYLVGETYDFNNRDFIKSFVDPSSKLDGQFDFPLRLNLLKAVVMRQPGYGLDQLAAFLDSNDAFYGPNTIMSPWVGNHDLGRVIHMAEDTPMWGEYDDGKSRAWVNQPQVPATRAPFERVANAFTVLFTNRGAPLIYYGDEIGLPGAGDPDNRRMLTFTGLTADQQWLKAQVTKLLQARADHVALRAGARTTLSVSNDSWAYSMKTEDDEVVVVLNRSDQPTTVGGLPRVGFIDLLDHTTTVSGPTVSLTARQARVLVRR